MMTNYFKMVCIATIIIFMFSCSEKNVSTDQHEFGKNSLEFVNPANPSNPLDSIGQDHNECMDYMGSYQGYDFTDSLAFINSFRNAFISYELSKGRTLSQQEKATFFMPGTYVSFSQVCLINLFSSEFQIYANAIKTQIYRSVESTADLLDVLANIRITETSIISSNTIVNSERQILLAYASISRYSTFYAYKIMSSNGTSNWHQTFNIPIELPMCTQKEIDQADSDGFWAQNNGSTSPWSLGPSVRASKKASAGALAACADKAGLTDHGDDWWWHVWNAFSW